MNCDFVQKLRRVTCNVGKNTPLLLPAGQAGKQQEGSPDPEETNPRDNGTTLQYPAQWLRTTQRRTSAHRRSKSQVLLLITGR